MARLRNLIIIAFLLFASSVQSEIYKTVDKDGNVKYSQTKPDSDTSFETIKPPPKITPPPVTPEPDSINSEGQVSGGENTQEDDETAAKNKEIEASNAEIKKKNCQNSKDLLNDLQNAGGRIKTTGDDGNVKWASDEEVQARKDHLKGNVDKWCN